MMLTHKANPLFATLVVVMTLLLCSEVGDGLAAGGPESCGEVGDKPKPATVLLQKRNEKLEVEDTGMADGTRLTDGGTADLQEGILRMNKSHEDPGVPWVVKDGACPPAAIVPEGKCKEYANKLKKLKYTKFV